MREPKPVRRHEQIQKAVVINVAPDRVAPRLLCIGDQMDTRRHLSELLGDRYRGEEGDEFGRSDEGKRHFLAKRAWPRKCMTAGYGANRGRSGMSAHKDLDDEMEGRAKRQS